MDGIFVLHKIPEENKRLFILCVFRLDNHKNANYPQSDVNFVHTFMGRMKCVPCRLLNMTGKSANCARMRIEGAPEAGSTWKQTINTGVFAQSCKETCFIVRFGKGIRVYD